MADPFELAVSTAAPEETRGLFLGSSHFAGKCGADLQEEVRRVALSIGHPPIGPDPQLAVGAIGRSYPCPVFVDGTPPHAAGHRSPGRHEGHL